jgi:hypothetical protein
MPFEIKIVCPQCKLSVFIPMSSGKSEDVPCPRCGKLLFTTRHVSGFIYILSNDHMPGLLKIGMTTRAVADRVAELNSATGVPTAFTVEACFECEDPASDEMELHKLLDAHRVPGREFFRISLEDAIQATRSVTKTPQLGGHAQPVPTSAWAKDPVWWRCPGCSHEFNARSGWCTRCGGAAYVMNYGR